MIKIEYPVNPNFEEDFLKEIKIPQNEQLELANILSGIPSEFKKFKDLNYILTASFKKIAEFAFSPASSNLDTERISEILNYDDKEKGIIYQPKIKAFFEKELEMKTCFFCNIDFVNSFWDLDDYFDFDHFLSDASLDELKKHKEIDLRKARKIIAARQNSNSSATIKSLIGNISKIELKEKYNHFTLDHVLGKKEHPLFALSLYNFVPSCYSCNSKFKASKKLIRNPKETLLSPTSDDFSVSSDLSFKILPKNKSGFSNIRKKNDFLLQIDFEANKEECENFLEIFKIKGRYNFHKDEVIKLIQKKERYGNSQIDEISRILNVPSEKIRRDIFGEELFEEGLSKESLCKLKKDIARNIKII